MFVVFLVSADEPVAEGSAVPSTSESVPAPEVPASWSESSLQDSTLAEARAHIERGEQLFDRANYDAALAEFEVAYDLLQGHPAQAGLLYNIGLCNEREFRYTRAMQSYQRYLQEAGPQAEDRQKVQATVDALTGLLAELSITTQVPAEVWIDDRPIGEAPGVLLVPGGRHTLELRAAGYEGEKREIQVAARKKLNLQVSLRQLGTRHGLSKTYFWTGAGATAMGLALGTGFGIQALRASRDAKDQRGGLAYANTQATKEDIDAKSLRADICFGVAGALALSTGILAIFTDWKSKERSQPKVQTRVSFGVGRDAALGQLTGQF